MGATRVSLLSKDFLSPPLLWTFARELEPACIHTKVNEELGQHDGAEVSLQDRDLPAYVPQAFAEKGLKPEDIGAPQGDDFRTVLFDGGDSLLGPLCFSSWSWGTRKHDILVIFMSFSCQHSRLQSMRIL